ncbi:transposase [Streptomyces sp. ATCC 21386]|nr:transposase [Streptomyces sp. ATCC 21386]
MLIDPEDLAAITPYITSRIRPFGDWKLDLTPPAALDIEVL